MHKTQHKNMIFKHCANAIIEHPGLSGFLSSIFTGSVYLINIPQTTEALELIGAVIKDVGLLAGSTVAVASFFSYAKQHWFKPKDKKDGNNSNRS